MKPFNLERALAGDPVCYRNGKEVLEWHYFEESSGASPIVSVTPEGGFKTHGIDGSYVKGDESDSDLVLKSVQKIGWINIYKTIKTGEVFTSGNIHITKEKAQNCRDHDSRYDKTIDCIQIEWEE